MCHDSIIHRGVCCNDAEKNLVRCSGNVGILFLSINEWFTLCNISSAKVVRVYTFGERVALVMAWILGDIVINNS